MELRLSGGHVAQIDDEDYERVRWYAWWWDAATERVKAWGNHYLRSVVTLHRIVLDVDEEECVRHLNGDGLDCRRSNLSVVGRLEQQAFQRPRADATSRYKGVYWNTQKNKWRVRLHAGGSRVSLGYYDLEEDAARAYDAGVREHKGFGYLNFPESQQL